MTRRRDILLLPASLLAGCGGGGGDSSSPNGRYQLDFSGARLEHALGSITRPQNTILRAELLIDGESIATFTSATGAQDAALLAKTVYRNAGLSNLDFRVVSQTINPSPYIVTPNGFVGIVDLQGGTFTVRMLNLGSLTTAYSATLRSGEAIRIPIRIP